MAIEFGDPQAMTFFRIRRESPKAEGKGIYTHGEKEVLAEKERREHGLPVNDNTMVEMISQRL